MRIPRCVPFVAVAVLGAVVLPSNGAAEVTLGDPPPAPTDVSNLPRSGHGARSATGGFSVNIDSREQVRSFYNAIYKSSDGVAMDTTANVSTCTPGTNSTAFKEAVLRRINWFRAMAGVPASVTLNAVNSAKDQEMAVLMSANNFIGHFPINTLPCFTANAANAASNSNLSLGSGGADAITGYIHDHDTNNSAVGHRRWILYPQTQVMGTGDVPQNGAFRPANATWITDGNFGGPRPATRKPYVSWPPAGFVPNAVVFPRWSFSFTNANFTNATVTMKSNGVSVATALEPVQPNIGENTVAWVPMGLDSTSNTTLFPFNGSDTVYTVTVTNIKIGLVTTGYTYTVTLFDPATPGADYFPPVVSGPNQPYVGQNNAYTFTALSNATSYEWRASLRAPYSFSDGAESGLGNFTVSTSAGYSVQNSGYHASGSFSFLLAHPDTSPVPPPSQILTLNQSFAPKTNGTLTIKSRLGYAANGETNHVQISVNGGSDWQDIFTQGGVGDGTSGPIENSFVTRSFPLNSFAGTSIKLRFNYTYMPGMFFIYPQGGFPIGWYIDDIVITNAELFTIQGTNNATVATNFTFIPSQAGTYNLDVRAFIFTDFPLDWGPAKTVTAISNTTPYIVLSRPVVTNSQVRLDFTVTNFPAFTFKLLQADQVGGPWTTNAGATLTTNVPGSSYRFTTAVGPAFRFYRVQTP